MTVADLEAANNLVIGPGVILQIDSGGFLFVANGLDDFGVVQVGSGDPPKLTVNGPVTVEFGAQIEASGEGTQIQLSNVTLSNLGTIESPTWQPSPSASRAKAPMPVRSRGPTAERSR